MCELQMAKDQTDIEGICCRISHLRDWQQSLLDPLSKGKGDPLICGSYRAIKLLDQTMKIYENVLEKRIRAKVTINEMQFCFLPRKGTTDAITIVRQLQEKHRQHNTELFYEN